MMIMMVIFALTTVSFYFTTLLWYKKSKIDPATYQVAPLDTVRTQTAVEPTGTSPS